MGRLNESGAVEERLALLLHPVRMRLVHALRAGLELTTAELCQRLPDLPRATLYRHVGRLVRGGVFEIADERRVRGAVERRYQLASGAAAVSREMARTMTPEDHRQAFTAAALALMADFGAYLDSPGADPTLDEVSYRQYVLWLTAAERSQLIGDLARLLRPLLARQPTGRAPYTFSTIFFPAGRTELGATPRSGPSW